MKHFFKFIFDRFIRIKCNKSTLTIFAEYALIMFLLSQTSHAAGLKAFTGAKERPVLIRYTLTPK